MSANIPDFGVTDPSSWDNSPALDANGNPIMNLAPMTVTGPISPVVVTAQKMAMPSTPFNLADWFQPPKLFITLAVAYVGFTLFLGRQQRPKRRRLKK